VTATGPIGAEEEDQRVQANPFCSRLWMFAFSSPLMRQLGVQDRRAKDLEPLPIRIAPDYLNEAVRQLHGVSWVDYGSSVVINRSTAPPIRFNSAQLAGLTAHQGNPEATAEIIQEVLRPKVRRQRKTRIRKRGFEKRIR
jgi:hypothetical protein